jgi:hypothetical protein
MIRRLFLVAGILGIGVAALWTLTQLDPVQRSPRLGETPLMTAAAHGDTAKVLSLLDHGADAHALTPDGKNAMDFAVLGGACQLRTIIALRERVPDLQLHEPSPFWRTFEVAKLKACALLQRPEIRY